MRNFTLLKSRTAAVVTGAVVVVGLGTTGATAAGLIDSDDIRNNSVQAEDVRRNAIGGSELAPGAVDSRHLAEDAVGLRDLRPFAQNQLDDSDELNAVRANVNGLEGRVSTVEQELAEGSPTVETLGHLLYGSPQQTTTLTYELAEPVALSDFDLTFFQERLHGSGSYGASVLLGVDVDGDGGYESDDQRWGTTPSAEALGDDTFVAMDATSPDTTKVDAPAVSQWWSPNAAGTGANNMQSSCWNTLAELVANCADVRFEPTSTVETVRFTMGGNPSWTDEAVRVTVLDDRLVLVGDDE